MSDSWRVQDTTGNETFELQGRTVLDILATVRESPALFARLRDGFTADRLFYCMCGCAQEVEAEGNFYSDECEIDPEVAFPPTAPRTESVFDYLASLR